MYPRQKIRKGIRKAILKHRRRLTALLFALLLCLTIGGVISYQLPSEGKNSETQVVYSAPAVPVNGSSPFGAGSERDYLLRRPDGHGGTVRVMVMLTGTHVMDIHCYAVASAYFADLPVVLVGYGEVYSHILKYRLFLGAANLAGLSDRDVVLALDGDVMFSGQDMLPYIDRFIAQSAASPRELDAKAVREGRAMAPVIYSAEKNCVWSQGVDTIEESCLPNYTAMTSLVKDYVHRSNGTFQPLLNPPDNPLRHINAGASIQRVWALRELNLALQRYMNVNRPLKSGPTWYDDQTIVHALYLNMVQWEMAQNVYFDATAAKTPTQYGLPAGLIAMDWNGEFVAPVSYDQQEICELTSERWKENIGYTSRIYGDKVTQYVKALHAATKDVVRFTHRPFTRSFSHVRSTDVAPPLLSVKPYHASGERPRIDRNMFPPISHYSGERKLERMKISVQYMPWYIPMMFDQDQWEKGRDYLLSMPMELWSATRRVRVRYADVCPQHPFSVRPKWS